jgi:hypothetical protein
VQFTEVRGGGAPEPTAHSASLRLFNVAIRAENLTGTPIPFGENSEEFDPDGMHDPGAPQFLTAKRAGTYLVMGEVSWQANVSGYRSLEIQKGGGVIGKVGGPALPPPAFTFQQVSAITRLSAGERVFLGGLQGSGTALIIDSARFSIAWLGA